ncbi:hypothetical protein [Paracoccus spongiarum]|uniref:Uncharacterized protein n=1 Tax=Paracoccus spongiarum TaxID=3064387 RepID=A0ABT9JCM2_9RHOB|nr:hypothetical protein [Paracoccus sp. 2205BS29-5]MDP5307584.1 hypothetical protein [Paracoccus sp. 2205BS29-5]
MKLMDRPRANDTGLPQGVAERLALFSKWTGAALFPADQMLEGPTGERTFSETFLTYAVENGLSLDWVYFGDERSLVLQAYAEAKGMPQ